jgi:hypothetical protein
VSANKLAVNKISLYDSWLTDMFPPEEKELLELKRYPGFLGERNPKI